MPQGLPALGLPVVSRRRSERSAAGGARLLRAGRRRDIGDRPDVRAEARHAFDANQELLALGAANLLAGLGRGFPVSGGMSQSLVNESAGARTPLSGLVAALFTLVVVLFASGLLRNLPQPVLAAIVLAAVMSLVDVAALQHIWQFSRAEFFVAIAALLGVLGSGPGQRRAARRRDLDRAAAPAGRAAARDRARPRSRARRTSPIVRANPENERTPGVLVVRCESALLYFNVEYVRERVFELLERARRSGPARRVFLGAVPNVDLAGAELLADLHRSLRARGVAFRLADAHGEVRDALRRIGFEREHGPLESGQTRRCGRDGVAGGGPEHLRNAGRSGNSERRRDDASTRRQKSNDCNTCAWARSSRRGADIARSSDWRRPLHRSACDKGAAMKPEHPADQPSLVPLDELTSPRAAASGGGQRGRIVAAASSWDDVRSGCRLRADSVHRAVRVRRGQGMDWLHDRQR